MKQYQTVNKPLVYVDILNAVEFYKEINPNLAHQFLFRLKETVTFIEKAPFAFQIKYKHVRTALVEQFPYHIHFLIDEKRSCVVILALIHAHRKPIDYSER